MAKVSHSNLTLHPGRNGIVVACGSEYVGKLVEVRDDGTAIVSVRCHHLRGAPAPREDKPPLSPPPPPPSRA